LASGQLGWDARAELDQAVAADPEETAHTLEALMGVPSLREEVLADAYRAYARALEALGRREEAAAAHARAAELVD